MLKSKEVLVSYLQEQCEKIVVNSNQCKKVYEYGNKNYGIPKGMMSDLVTKRSDLSKVTNFVLFVLLESLFRCDDSESVIGVDKYFTMQEAKVFRTTKYEVDKITFPIVFKMIQVADDQWIGNIDVVELMRLRRAQLVVYNVATQRMMTRVIKGEEEHYKITINQKAIKEIQSSFEKNEFISNTITLNISTEVESDFYYDTDKCELVINSLECFHIIDGFHRYLSLSQQYDLDDNFNYPMELRVVNWNENKAKTFIYQEDHRTPIAKTKSGANSFNMNSAANIITERINNNVLCNVKGLIGRNDGIINYGDFSDLVNWFYIKNNKERSNAIQIKAVKELVENLNIITELNSRYVEEKWNYQMTISVMCVFDYFNKTGKNKRNMDETIQKVYDQILNSEEKVFKIKGARKILIDKVINIIQVIVE